MPGAERVLDFAEAEAYLSLRNAQLVIQRDGQAAVTTPVSEAAVVLLASRRVTCTVPLLDALMQAGAAVLVCAEDHLPSGLMLPLAGHFQQTQRMLAQARAPGPLQKQVWKQIVQAKIRAQGALLLQRRGDDAGLFEMALTVRSGDPKNVEAHAAQRYWPLLFDNVEFRRRRDAPDQNRLLNYGYAVLRAAVGRALCAAGLHPSLGVHHHGRNNPFCLADDLMEPFRPLVDDAVVEMVGEFGPDVPFDGPRKGRLIGVLHERLIHDGEERTAFDWIGRTAASLARMILREDTKLFFPDGLTQP